MLKVIIRDALPVTPLDEESRKDSEKVETTSSPIEESSELDSEADEQSPTSSSSRFSTQDKEDM